MRPSRIFEILNLGCNVAHCDENLGHCILGRLKTNVPPTKIFKKLWQDQQMAKSVLKRVEMIGNYLPLFATYYRRLKPTSIILYCLKLMFEYDIGCCHQVRVYLNFDEKLDGVYNYYLMHNGRPVYRKDSTNYLLFFVNKTSGSGPSRWIIENGFLETEYGLIRYEGENNCPYENVPFKGQTWSNVHAMTIVDPTIWITCDLGNTGTFITSYLFKSI